MTRRLSAMLAVAALGAAGCGLDDPYNTPERVENRNSPRAELVAEPAADASEAGGPEETLERLALTRGNWTTSTVAQAYEGALALTTGDAAAQLREYGESLVDAVEANPAPLRSSVVVEAVVVRGGGDRRSGLVVTREVVSGGSSQEDERYQVTVATVERQGTRWVVSEWKPQS